MSRTISRPFGRGPAQPQQAPADDAPIPSVTEFVLRDTDGDTPHDIHPHAAAWSSQQSNPMDQAPMRIPTGSNHKASGRPRPATAEERAAYVRMRNARMQAEAAPAAQPPTDAPYSPPLANYALTATGVDPSFRVPATATYDAPQQAPTPPPPQTPAPVPPRPVSPAPSDASVLDPAMPAAATSPRLGSPLVLSPPKRVSSLAPAPRPVSSGPTRPAELEITYTSPTGRSVTVRLFAP